MQANPKVQLPQKKMWRRWILAGIVLIFFGINGAGLFIGNMVYQETKVLHSQLHAQEAVKMQQKMEKLNNIRQWQDVELESQFGYQMKGTYIPNPQPTDKTMIFVHGFTESRMSGLNYLNIYLDQGFNVLLIDLRAHGESGGNSVTWGVYEKYDLTQWVAWVREHFPAGEIGVHGNSMGAATALMQAELNEKNRQVAFYIVDSAYSDLEKVLDLQMEQHFHLSETLLLKMLLPYANFAAYLNDRFTFYQASPMRAVRNVTTPILYLHGEHDKLVPVYMAQELYQATRGPREIYIFPEVEHVGGIFDEPVQYEKIVHDFIHSVEQQSFELYR